MRLCALADSWLKAEGGEKSVGLDELTRAGDREKRLNGKGRK